MKSLYQAYSSHYPKQTYDRYKYLIFTSFIQMKTIIIHKNKLHVDTNIEILLLSNVYDAYDKPINHLRCENSMKQCICRF